MSDVDDRDWFADLADEDDRDPKFPWQPFLQCGGCCLPLPIWFATEQECLTFIRDEVAGRGLLDDQRASLTRRRSRNTL